MGESMSSALLGTVIKNGKGTTMRETVISRTAFVVAAGTALLTLVGCGGQQAQDTTGFNDDRPVKDKMDAGSSSGDSGDAGGSSDADGGSTAACSASAISARTAQPNGSVRTKSESSTRAEPGAP